MKYVKLTDVCDFQGGTQPPKSQWSNVSKPNYIRMLQIRDFTQKKDEHIEYVCKDRNLKICNTNDILIGRYGASIGKILTGLAGAYNVAMIKADPIEKCLYKKYLYHILISQEFQGFIKNISVRAAQAGFNKEDLSQFEFYLPPLPEQKRIADILDRADELRTKRRQAIEHLNELKKSIFLDMFGDPVTNPKGWKVCPLSMLTIKIGSGSTPLGGDANYKDHGISLIRSLNVHDHQFKYKDLAFIDEKQAKKLSNVEVKKDDILFNITGASVARVCQVPENILPARVNQHVAIIRCNEKINTLFLESFLKFPSQKKLLLKIARSAGATREAITKKNLEDILIMTPPRNIQDSFSEKIIRLDKLSSNMTSFLNDASLFFSSLQDRAFKGELSKNDSLESILKNHAKNQNKQPESQL